MDRIIIPGPMQEQHHSVVRKILTGKVLTEYHTFVRWPGHFPAGITLNGIVSHEDWLPTFAAIAGDTDVKEKLLKVLPLMAEPIKIILMDTIF